ncbi:MAG: UDP-N-acetylmuramoyl-L-alanyl-D-glutamate--2,6-diaminopimelate ligase [Phycisphaeraceae bacterium]|nr:UDP-N-acetylmuramoyl-L-alanyl-D-glutamate--2,6-diaminopimelate ligase [Phycisphaeraceae bacterium]
MLVGDLISGLDIRPMTRADSWQSVRVCDITEDSRTALTGTLFVARRGEHADGRRFVPSAIAAGAVAVLTDDPSLQLPAGTHAGEPVALLTPDINLAGAQIAERFYGSPASRLAMIGVTGTNGKTTITFLIHQLLNALGVRTGLIGTVQIDDGREVAPATLTTPPAIELSRTLATMVESGCEAAVMEVSSHALHQRRVGALRFDIGVFTNLTGDHLDYHKTMESYADAKAMLFGLLGEDGVAVVNADDPWHERMVRGSRGRVLRCSMAGDPSLALRDGGRCGVVVRQADQRHTSEVLMGPWGALDASVRLIGAHNSMNLLQAVAAVHATGESLRPRRPLDAADLKAAVDGLSPPPGRLEPVSDSGDSVTVFVDYAHSDDAIRSVLGTLRATMSPADSGRLWIVFGCGGDRDRTKRPRMGAAAAELADRIIVTSDNPRTESPSTIIDEILAGIPAAARERTSIDADRERAIHRGIADAAPGDVVLIAGKGHEDYQILPDGRGGTVTRQFSDRLVARAALSARRSAVPEVVSRARPSTSTRVRRTEST